MKLITKTFRRPFLSNQTKAFLNFDDETKAYFDILQFNCIDYSMTFHIGDDDVHTLHLIEVVPEEKLDVVSRKWEALVDRNLSDWFKTETFVTVRMQDVVGQAKSAS